MFLSALISLKMHGSLENDPFLVEKLKKKLAKYCPFSNGTDFNTKFVLDSEMRNNFS